MSKPHERKSNTTTWLTPLSLVRALGTFDLDPCAYPRYRTANALIYPPGDGLTDPWSGRVWLNPPYGSRVIDPWLAKMWQHRCGTALVPARTETNWFQDAFDCANAALFIRGRIAFLDPETMQPVDGNPVGSVLLAYGRVDAAALIGCVIPGRKVLMRI